MQLNVGPNMWNPFERLQGRREYEMASEWKRDYRMGNPTLALTGRRTNRHILLYTKLSYIQSRTQSYSKVSWEVCIEAMLILFCFSSQNHFPVEGRFPALTTLTTTRPKRWWRSSSNSFLILIRIGYFANLPVKIKTEFKSRAKIMDLFRNKKQRME